ncbi:hypothetical protein [Neomegalonema sp.]|uniref:hypothetical protein n=1 Tax=Neomegalonema sp. TaxID=2039713 RepID=UPI002636E61A|nr:hypothetical protein [Neomegalonema sp.]MDD2870221.1 hypothetical protein [Neomegalonema sp.]
MIACEAFSQGKLLARPEANEDAFLLAPGRGHVVIDGVSDRTGARLDGMATGLFVAQAVRRAFLRLFAEDSGAPGAAGGWFGGAEDLVRRLSGAVEAAYAAAGAAEAVAADPRLRGGCAFAAVLHVGDRLEFVGLGDCGVRVNGAETLLFPKDLDSITATLRREAWRRFEARGLTPEACDALARRMVQGGLAHQEAGSPTADPAFLAEVEAALRRQRGRLWPHVPEAEFAELIAGGIAHGQDRFLDEEGRVLGYGAMNGAPTPARFIEARSWALAEVETLELFSDGYFALGEGFGVASWEAAARRVEAEDPHKLEAWLSTKGSTPDGPADDRTYLGLRLR